MAQSQAPAFRAAIVSAIAPGQSLPLAASLPAPSSPNDARHKERKDGGAGCRILRFGFRISDFGFPAQAGISTEAVEQELQHGTLTVRLRGGVGEDEELHFGRCAPSIGYSISNIQPRNCLQCSL